MAPRIVQFRNMNYDNLSHCLVFTDIKIGTLSGDFVVDKDIMIKFVEKSKNMIKKLKNNFSTSSLTNREKVKKILFLFPLAEKHENFVASLNKLFADFVKLFPNAKITTGILQDLNGLSTDMDIIKLENAFITSKELSNFIHYGFAKKQIRFNYTRCHHILLNYLKKRCKNGVNFKFDAENAGNFYISNNKTMMLSFVRNAAEESYYVYVNSQNDQSDRFIFVLKNSHLLGLYNPSLLFKVASKLLEIKNFTGFDIKIIDNEIVLLDCQENLVFCEEIFEKIISKFDHFLNSSKNSKKFKIQLHLDKKFVINRKLKTSLSVLKVLLDKNATELFIDLALSYFKCFSIAPICCRMQSIAPEAIFYDFEKFTYSHINRYRCNYIKICKLLFPFVASVEDSLLLRKYLEIVPVTLIGRLHGSYFEHFLTTLKILEELDIKVIPLANGNFRLSSFFTVTPEMLTKIVDPSKIPKAIDKLRTYVAKENIELVKHEDVEGNSQNYFEIKNVTLFFSHTDYFIFQGSKNLFSCPNENSCDANLSQSLAIISSKNCQLLAFIYDELATHVKEIQEICTFFSGAFKPLKAFLFYPVCHSFCNKVNDFTDDANTYTAGYLPLETSDKSYDFWIYDARFLFENIIAKKNIQKFASDLKSFEEEDGIPLAFVKDKIVTLENYEAAIADLYLDNYKATADFGFYNDEEIEKFFDFFKSAKDELDLDELFFEITNFGLIRFNNLVEIQASIFFMVGNPVKLTGIIKNFCLLMASIFDDFMHPPITFLSIPTLANTNETRFLKPLALALNQILTDKCDFNLPNFCCIPQKMFVETKVSVKVFKDFRIKNVQIKISPIFCDTIFFDNFSFFMSLRKLKHCPLLFDLLEQLEQINENFEEVIMIQKGIFFIVDYEDLERTRFHEGRGTFSSMTAAIDNETIQSCFKMFENNTVSSVILATEMFQINKGILISVKDLSTLSPEIQKILFKMAENISEFYAKIGCGYFDNMMHLKSSHNPLINQISENKKFHNFSIVDDNRGTYLKLARIINCNLDGISDEKLLSYEWLKTIPEEFLMDMENAQKLLNILQSLKNEGITFRNTNNGSICMTCGVIPVPQLLQLYHFEKFGLFLKFFDKLCIGCLKKPQLYQSGLFSSVTEVESYVESPDEITINEIIVKKVLRYFLDKNELPVVLSSDPNIMLGNTIWISAEELDTYGYNFFYQMIKCFEHSFTPVHQDLMKSVHDLAQKNQEEVVNLARIINGYLREISKSDICHEKLRIFPTDLHNALKSNLVTYENVINIFELLIENKIYSGIKLNGNIDLKIGSLVITFTHLLKLNYEKEKFKELGEFVKNIYTTDNDLILCEEEITIEYKTSERVAKTQIISSYNQIIEAKEMVKNHKDIQCRIQSNGILCLNENLWVRAEELLENPLRIIEISKKLKQIFTEEHKFQYGSLVIPILATFKSTDEELYQYCYNMCQYINENYQDISIQYFPTTNFFKFNEVLSIHPRSFFNLQNIDKVVKVLRKFKNHKEKQEKFNQEKSKLSKNEMYKKQKELENEEKHFCKELWEIKKEERVETDFIKEKCFDKISKIIQKPINFARLESMGNISKMNENKPFHGLEDIRIQEEYIFRNGNTNGFVNIDKSKGEVVFAYKNKKIVDAIEMADKLDENFRCKNLSDFQSLIEILTSYDSFNAKRKALKFNDMPKDAENKELHEKINWWLIIMEEKQSKQQKYKFGNALKALHHWFKHSEGFENLEHWYREIEKFFENTNYEFEMDTQNGEFIGRRYENEKYFGVYSIAHEDAKKDNFVTTFWFKGKSESKMKKKKECFEFTKTEECSKYLIITDTEFGNFNADVKYILNDKITVKTVLKHSPNFSLLTEHINKGKYENAENVEKLLLFLTDTVKNKNTIRIQGKRKDGSKMFHEEEKDYEKCLDMLLTAIESKFTSFKSIILCYVDNTEEEKVVILKKFEPEKCKLQEINEDLVVGKDAADLKDFLEATFTPEINNL